MHSGVTPLRNTSGRAGKPRPFTHTHHRPLTTNHIHAPSALPQRTLLVPHQRPTGNLTRARIPLPQHLSPRLSLLPARRHALPQRTQATLRRRIQVAHPRRHPRMDRVIRPRVNPAACLRVSSSTHAPSPSKSEDTYIITIAL